MGLSAQPRLKSSQVPTPRSLQLGLGRTASHPDFGYFFRVDAEAMCRVLREKTDKAGLKEGEAGGEPSRRPPHFRVSARMGG